MEGGEKGRVCVTGGRGFLASWLIMKLLQHGYSVNTTVRSHPSGSKDISFLTSLPHAQERLRIFTADLNHPESFKPAIEGCVGVFHLAHPSDFEGTADMIVDKTIPGTLGILQACIDSKTVKRVVYTSGISAVAIKDRGENGGVLDEDSWSDVDFIRKLNIPHRGYFVSKTVTERAALEFAENHGLDMVTVIPSIIHGPFVCSSLPGAVHFCLRLILGVENEVKYRKITPMVHTDDVAEAHIHLFECQEAKGRYICSAVEATIEEMTELISSRYPEYKLLTPETITDIAPDFGGLSSNKLLETGFRYKYGLEEMFDDAIKCCKQKAFI